MISTMPRHWKTKPRRMGPIIQSYKKVLKLGPTSRAAAAQLDIKVVEGEDSVAAGQTAQSDAGVPTGAVVKYFDIQHSVINLAVQTLFFDVTIQLLHAGQTAVDVSAVGITDQRNQVFHQRLASIGFNQNNNFKYRFKIPKKFQRVRRGDSWVFSFKGSAVYTESWLCIYKFYR